MCVFTRIGLPVALLLVPLWPAEAQTGGGLAAGVPSNPFASNYPSAPRPHAVPARTRQHRRIQSEPAPVPPGRIPR